MKLTKTGVGWMRWDVVDIGGGFTATISDVNNYVFKEMHDFFIAVAKGKPAKIVIDQEGTEFTISTTPTKYQNKSGDWPYRDSDTALDIEQTLWPRGKKTLQDLPINGVWLAKEYIEAFEDLLKDKKYDDWKESELFLDSFKELQHIVSRRT